MKFYMFIYIVILSHQEMPTVSTLLYSQKLLGIDVESPLYRGSQRSPRSFSPVMGEAHKLSDLRTETLRSCARRPKPLWGAVVTCSMISLSLYKNHGKAAFQAFNSQKC